MRRVALGVAFAWAGAPVAIDLASAWGRGPTHALVLGPLGVVLVVLGWWRASRSEELAEARAPSALVAIAGAAWVLGELGLAPVLRHAGVVGVGGALAMASAGRSHRSAVGLGVLLCAASIPPPPELALPAGDWLRVRVGDATAAILRGLGHTAEADYGVVRFAGGRLLIVSACDGTRSLAVLVGAALVWSTWAGPRGYGRRALLVGLVPGLAVAANLVRIVAAAMLARAGWGELEGLHRGLGLVVFVLPLGAILLLARALTEPRAMSSPPAQSYVTGRSAWSVFTVGMGVVVFVVAARTVAARRAAVSDPGAVATRVARAETMLGGHWHSGALSVEVAASLVPDRVLVRVVQPEGGYPYQLVVLDYDDLRRAGSPFEHSPEGCYKVGGWRVTEPHTATPGGRPVRVFHARRGREARTIAYWYETERGRAIHRAGLYLDALSQAVLDGRTGGRIVILTLAGVAGEELPTELERAAAALDPERG